MNQQNESKNSYLALSPTQRKVALQKFKHQPFSYPDLTFQGFKNQYKIRPNRLVVRVFQPRGFTVGGIYLERNHTWPNIFGHVMAIHANVHDLVPGDFIMFTHLTDELLHNEGEHPNEVEYVLIHTNSIKCSFGQDTIRLERVQDESL